MKKQGFTLIELLGVITIMAVISIVALPPIISQISKNQGVLSEVMKNIIYTASTQYVDVYEQNYIKLDGNTYCIELKELVDKGFLSDPIIDPVTNKNMNLNDKLQAKVQYGNFIFNINNN